MEASRNAAADFAASRVSGERLLHAYIITGSDTDGRREAARYIARTAVCEFHGSAPCLKCRQCEKVGKDIHPDVITVNREKDARELTVDVVRTMRTSAVILPNEAEHSVYIIPDGDSMNVQAQNAVLKLLEEPPRHAVFLIMAENPERLLPTVRSRCEELRLPPVLEKTDEERAEKIVSFWEKRDDVSLLKELTAAAELSRESLNLLCVGISHCTVKRLEQGNGARSRGEFLRLNEIISKAEKYLEANVSSGNVAGMLLAELLAD